MGNGPQGSTRINTAAGAPQQDIFEQYKLALMRASAADRGTAEEELRAKREKRAFDPVKAEGWQGYYLSRMHYRSKGARYHSFVVYFSNLRRLGWVEPSGEVEPSQFQENYPEGAPRVYYCLTEKGRLVSPDDWRDPLNALYPGARARSMA